MEETGFGVIGICRCGKSELPSFDGRRIQNLRKSKINLEVGKEKMKVDVIMNHVLSRNRDVTGNGCHRLS